MYELWDLETANMIGEYETREDALVEAKELIAANEGVYPERLGLLLQIGAKTESLLVGEEFLDAS